jgi:hypothetical protein
MTSSDVFKSITVCMFWTSVLLLTDAGRLSAQLPEESRACLECHGQKGLTVTFQDHEQMDAFVNREKFSTSVHASLPCSSCHPDFSKDAHPSRSFRSRQQYSLKSSLVCRLCHPDEQIKKSAIHASLLDTSDTSPVCSSCHSPHAITPLENSRKFSTEKQYCLGCHRQSLVMKLRNSEKVSLKVDAGLLHDSVHSKLGCVDCHFGFSGNQHPKRNFADQRNFSISHSDACRRCHFDKYTKTLESIHFTMLSQGNLKAPVCTDCHGSHSIERAQSDKSVGARRCGNCHRDIYSTYASSVHGNALLNEKNTDVPVCIDCHSAHTIEDARTVDYRDKVPEICGRCHANKDIMKRYGLNTGVVNSYLQDFHGITLTLYKQQKNTSNADNRKSIATCTDCHGIHDITKATGSDARVVKTKLVKRCQKCHAGATDEFPDAWLSHYEPTLANAPIVFAINLIYKYFIPFMLLGLILQIFLHIWRYTVNR